MFVLQIVGAIGPATTLYIRQGFSTAQEQGASLIIIRMNTPGGLDSAMRDIISDILASPVPILAYVAPSGARAASAGTYILYASHLAAMAPGTHLGAATPVQLGGGQPLGRDSPGRGGDERDRSSPDAAASKAINDAVAYIRGLAGLRGRNAEWAENAVRQAATLTATEALERNVIEIVATDLPNLLAQIDGRPLRLAGRDIRLSTANAVPIVIEPNWRAQFLAVITDPNIAYILLLVGIYGILFEFFSPGTIFSGVIGAIALLIALFALNLMPINYAGIGLIALGVALMAAEAFTPSFGILGIGGVVALMLGSLFLFDGDVPGFTISLPVILIATAASAVLIAIGGAAALRSRRLRVVTGEPGLLDAQGRVLEWSGDRGQVMVQGERWRASGTTALAPGQAIRVRSRDGLNLVVEPEPTSNGGERHADKP